MFGKFIKSDQTECKLCYQPNWVAFGWFQCMGRYKNVSVCWKVQQKRWTDKGVTWNSWLNALLKCTSIRLRLTLKSSHGTVMQSCLSKRAENSNFMHSGKRKRRRRRRKRKKSKNSNTGRREKWTLHWKWRAVTATATAALRQAGNQWALNGESMAN